MSEDWYGVGLVRDIDGFITVVATIRRFATPSTTPETPSRRGVR